MTFWQWVLFVLVTDVCVFAIRGIVLVCFGETKFVQKNFKEPTETMENFFEEEINHIESERTQLLCRGLVLLPTVICWTVPFANVLLGLIVDPMVCVLIAHRII